MMSGSSPAHSATAMAGERGGERNAAAAAALSADDFFFPVDLISVQDRKDEAMLVIKSDLMDTLNMVVKSLDEDNWMFEGPRHRLFNPVSRQGGVLQKHIEISNNWNKAPPK